MKSNDPVRPERFFYLFSIISSLAGVGPKVSLAFQNLGITRVRDLLFFLPVGGVRRLRTDDLSSVSIPQVVTIEVTVNSHKKIKNTGPTRVFVTSSDTEIELVFFHAKIEWIKSLLPENSKRIISGKIEHFKSGLQMVHPDYIVSSDKLDTIPDFEPIYPLSRGISQKLIIKTVSQVIDKTQYFVEWIDKDIIKRFAWPTFNVAIVKAHKPSGMKEIEPKYVARERLAYDELFAHQISLALARMYFRKTKGLSINGSRQLTGRLRKKLPFSLTSAQKRAITTIDQDLSSTLRMNRLLQGDVGSGKTIVALISMLTVVEFGGQAALLAPTEMLAIQHFNSINNFLEDMNVCVVLLTGRDRGTSRRLKLAEIKSGRAQIIIGTHALFQENVMFNNLIFAVIDEQHRFGVQQRMALGQKGINIDVLVMTATPIPRSLSLTYYGDMDISLLDEKPRERKPIITAVMSDSKLEKIFDRLDVSLNAGRRVYWVCPLIEDSAVLQLTSAELRYRVLKDRFPKKVVALVHGQMTSDNKDNIMREFTAGEIDLLVSTTVIEVGLDVPAASIMIVEGAERFGLAQLHQLRGRVGRGSDQSSCILVYSGNLGKNSKARLDILRDTEDGFRIAEEDLRIRGAGDVLGSQQSGLPKFLIADLETQSYLLEVARKDAQKLLSVDPTLVTPRGAAVRDLLYLMDLQRALIYIQVG